MVARRLVITGRVQGVGFRYFVYEAAQRLDVRGWVANRSDGSVEVHAEAEDSAIMDKFLALAAGGPPWSIIEEFDVREVEPQDHPTFRITR